MRLLCAPAQRLRVANKVDELISLLIRMKMPVRADQIVDDGRRRWSSTFETFLRHKMHCVGCPVAPFHTVEEACREHGIELGPFLAALQGVAAPLEAEAGQFSPKPPRR